MRSEELFKAVAIDLISRIESGAGDWRMPWHHLGEAGLPRNAEGRPYRGWNTLVLMIAAANRGWRSGTWATYRGWQRAGGQVRAAEKGTQIVVWKPSTSRSTPTSEEPAPRRQVFARPFTVFAQEQVDGVGPKEVGDQSTPLLESAERFFTAVGADVVHGGDAAYYLPIVDRIYLPQRKQFDAMFHYYSTAAHEHVHWTGHASRIHRDLRQRFGAHAYAAEELVAELGAAFWCAQFEMEQATREDHAAYLSEWLVVLRQEPRALVVACGHAQRAVDFLNSAAAFHAETADPAANDG